MTFRGNGENIISIDWENDLVVVVRWLAVPGRNGGSNAFFQRVLGAITN